jgi:hypothetical protein
VENRTTYLQKLHTSIQLGLRSGHRNNSFRLNRAYLAKRREVIGPMLLLFGHPEMGVIARKPETVHA